MSEIIKQLYCNGAVWPPDFPRESTGFDMQARVVDVSSVTSVVASQISEGKSLDAGAIVAVPPF